MKIKYQQLLNIKKEFNGIDRGFRLLDLILKKVEKELVLVTDERNIINIYDYSKDKSFQLKADPQKFINVISNLYLDFLVQELRLESKWFCEFYDHVFNYLSADFDSIVSMAIIRVLLECFILLINFENVLDTKNFRSFLMFQFRSRFRNLTDNQVEVFVDTLFESLFFKRFLLKSSLNSTFSITDDYIVVKFCVVSSFLPDIYSKYDFDIKYNPKYSLDNLFDVIQNYLIILFSNEDYLKGDQYFSNKYPELEYLFNNFFDFDLISFNYLEAKNEFDRKMFKFLIFKNILLNEYCLHVIIMSCFDYYVHTKHKSFKNVLIDYPEFRSKFQSVFVDLSRFL